MISLPCEIFACITRGIVYGLLNVIHNQIGLVVVFKNIKFIINYVKFILDTTD